MIYDKQIAMKLYDQFNINRFNYQKAYDYYIGETDIVHNYPVTDRSNRKVQDNFIKAFLDEEVSFMTGLPVTYASRSDNTQSIEDIEYNLNNISSTIDTSLATNLLMFGEAYEFYYLNNGEFKIKIFNRLNSIPFCDVEGNVQLFMYFYKKELDDNKIYIEVIDDNYIYHFNESFTQIAEPTPHYFKQVPVGIARLENGLQDTLYYNLKSLQDNYESLMSDWQNEIGDSRLAYLLFYNASISDEDTKKMKEMGIIQLPGEKSKAEWLIKNQSSDFYKSNRDIIKEDIYRVGQHIDNQTQVQSNTSGTMLSIRLNCLRLKISTQNQSLKNCIKTRIKCLFTYLNIAESKNYNYRDINIKPQLNLPSNDLETSQILSQLNGKLSTSTGLERLSFITNGRAEFEKMLAEQKEIADSQAPQIDLNSIDVGNENGQ